MVELWEVFVRDAPNQGSRQRIYDAFAVYTSLVWESLPTARLWVNGGFVTYKTDAPHDIDVVIVTTIADFTAVPPEAIGPLLTLQAVSVAQPTLTLSRLQPFGGLIDGFLAFEDLPPTMEAWKDSWSLVWVSSDRSQGWRQDISKGFLEVKNL